MKAAYIQQPGPPETIQFGELPDPRPKPDELLIRVKAVAVNPIDTYIRAGKVQFDLPQPYIVGCDVAGEVVSVGTAVQHFRPGQRVWASNQGMLGRQGTFAELVTVAEPWAYPIPQAVPAESVAALALVGITAHLGLLREAQLQAGETLALIGGSGGVGSAVLQIAKALGARVVTTAGGAAKAELCRQLGADAVVDYHQEDLYSGLKRHLPDGADVFWETRREPDFALVTQLLRPRGRMVLMAGRDATPPFPVGPFYVNELRLFGFVMFKAPVAEQARAAADLNRWLEAGQLKPVIDRIMPLAETAEAHRLQESGSGLKGKIVLQP